MTTHEPNTKRRIILAISALVVIAIALSILNAVIKTHKKTSTSYAGVATLNIKVGNAKLVLTRSNDDSLTVNRKVDYLLRGPSLTQKVTNDTLNVRQNCSGLHIGECDTTYAISVPDRVSTVVVSSASVSVDGTQGSFNVQTSGGKISLGKTFGDLTLSTDSGEIAAKDLSSLKVSATTKGGKIGLGMAVAPTSVTAKTTDGEIDIKVPKSNTAYAVDAGSANAKSTVDVTDQSSSPRTISAHSTNGKVTVEAN